MSPSRRGVPGKPRAAQAGSAASLASGLASAILLKVMATYRELLAQVKDEIDEVSSSDVLERLDDADRPLLLDVREQDEWQEGHLPGAIHVARGNLESRDRGDSSPTAPARSSSTAPSAHARRSPPSRSPSSATRTSSSMIGGFTDWKRNGYAFRRRASLTRRAARPLLAPHPHPRGRRGGAAEAARCPRAPDRRRRARLALVALSRRGRRRHARHRRRRRRRRLEPAAPDRALDEHARRAEGALGEARARGAQPRRQRASPTRSGSRPRTSSGSSPTAGT